MPRLQRIAYILDRMYGVINKVNWFTNIDTSLYIFIDEIPIICNFLYQHENINTSNVVVVGEISRLCTNDPTTFGRSALKQRLNFFVLLGLVIRNDVNIYSPRNLDLVYYTNDRIALTFIENSTLLFRDFNQFNTETKKNYSHILKMFAGFYVYLIWNLLGENEFRNIPLQNDGARSRINDINIVTMRETYAEFCDRFFDHLDIDEVILIGYNLFNDELEFDNIENNKDVSVLEIRNIENNQNVITPEIKSIENNQDLNMQEIKTPETYGSFEEELKAEEAKNKNGTSDKDNFNTVFRKGFSEKLKEESKNISHILFDDKSEIDIVFLEAAHIIPVSDISTLRSDAKDKNNKILNDIIKLTRSTKNGVLIPFNYHKFFDKKYIELSKSENKFILTKVGEDNVSTLERLGFKNCHSLNKNKYDEIINTINEYDEMLRELKSINN